MASMPSTNALNRTQKSGWLKLYPSSAPELTSFERARLYGQKKSFACETRASGAKAREENKELIRSAEALRHPKSPRACIFPQPLKACPFKQTTPTVKPLQTQTADCEITSCPASAPFRASPYRQSPGSSG